MKKKRCNIQDTGKIVEEIQNVLISMKPAGFDDIKQNNLNTWEKRTTSLT